MPYVPLQIPEGAPEALEQIVRDRIDPILRDVHAMLRLPIDDVPGLEAGCNLSAALVLLEVVSGVSAVLYADPELEKIDKRQRSGEAFKRLLLKHYPWDEEPDTAETIREKHAAEILYQAFRNPLAHSFGIDSETAHGQRKVAKGPLSDNEIVSIERSQDRPEEWPGPTLRTDSRSKANRTKTVLTVKLFYWGVRQMIQNVLKSCANVTRQQPGAGQPRHSISITATATTAGTLPTMVPPGPNNSENDGA